MNNNKFMVLALAVIAIAAISQFATKVEGENCGGIKITHVDPTPAQFADGKTIAVDTTNGLRVIPDDVTLEVDSTNGLQVKDNGVTQEKINNFAPYYLVPRWNYKIANTSNYTKPSQFTSSMAEGSRVSFGDISLYAYSILAENSVLFEMKVYSDGNNIVTQKLLDVDDVVYCYLNGNETTPVFSRTSSGWFGNSPLTITWNLVDGENLLQIVANDYGGGGRHLHISGNIINGSNIYYVAP